MYFIYYKQIVRILCTYVCNIYNGVTRYEIIIIFLLHSKCIRIFNFLVFLYKKKTLSKLFSFLAQAILFTRVCLVYTYFVIIINQSEFILIRKNIEHLLATWLKFSTSFELWQQKMSKQNTEYFNIKL